MPFKDANRRIESDIKSDFMKYTTRWYPLAHTVLIPATFWRLLPYDLFILHEGLLRAVELKIDDNPVMAHQYHALFQVVQNKGYAFVVRWLNGSRKFIVENFTLGTSEMFSCDQSERQRIGNSTVSKDDRPFSKETAFRKTIDYIMGFEVSPIEAEIQRVLKQNYEKVLKVKLEKM